jgi:hypothetical protein
MLAASCSGRRSAKAKLERLANPQNTTKSSYHCIISCWQENGAVSIEKPKKSFTLDLRLLAERWKATARDYENRAALPVATQMEQVELLASARALYACNEQVLALFEGHVADVLAEADKSAGQQVKGTAK